MQHDSGCAVHNGPALPKGVCDCGACVGPEKAERIAAALVWLPLEAECDDGLEDILNAEQLVTIKNRIVSALLEPDVYDLAARRRS